MTLLVAGFSAFPGAPENPTETLMASLAGSVTASGVAIETMVLPVEWDGAFPPLAAAMLRLRPEAIVLFGLNARAERIRLELTGHNERSAERPDAAGVSRAGPVAEGGPASTEARLPLAAVMRRLRAAGVDFELSRDPGRYLCNDTLYRLCGLAPAAGIGAYGFVHVPLTDEAAAGWAEAGALPALCRTLPAAELERAARAVCDGVTESRNPLMPPEGLG